MVFYLLHHPFVEVEVCRIPQGATSVGVGYPVEVGVKLYNPLGVLYQGFDLSGETLFLPQNGVFSRQILQIPVNQVRQQG